MSLIEGYHSIVGDQSKVYIEVAKAGFWFVKAAMYEGERKIARKKTTIRLKSQVPNRRVHISGELMYVH